MWRNYLTTALRNITRNRLTAFLNILGLALGFAAALLALLYVRHEMTYDRFIPGHDRVYVMVLHQTLKGAGTRIGDRSPAYFADWIKADFSGVQVARLMPVELTVRHGDAEATEETGWADPNFFSLLRLPAIAGDLQTALARPDGLVITRRMARKYFGRDLPVGETLELKGRHSFQIAAVIEDLPAATHLAPEIFGSALNREFGLQRYDEVPWPVNGETPVMTYIRVPDRAPASIAELQRAMPAFVQRHMGRLFDLFQSQYSIDVRLLPLAKLHLYPNDVQAMKPHGKPAIVAAAGITGFLIAFVAIINFVNLMTAHSTRRAVEVGVRKVCGGQRFHLMMQFIGESLIYAITAMGFAMVLVSFVLPAVDSRLAPGIAEQWLTVPAVMLAGGFAVITGILGGVYPAFVLSAFRPASVLKGRLDPAGSGTGRQSLVALQFSVLIALILATLVIYRQTAFGLHDGLRFPQDQMLIVYAHCPTPFTEQVRGLSGVSGAACAAGDPTNFAPRSFTQATRANGTRVTLGIGGVGFGLFELFGVHPLAGRLYDSARDAVAAEDDRAPLAVLNETAVRVMGFASPKAAIGQAVASIQNQDGPPSEVIGVVPDFTFDLQGTRIGPIIYWVHASYDGDSSVVNVKLTGRDVLETLDAIDALWKRTGEQRPIRRLFMEQHLQAQYVATIQQGAVIGGLAGTAIIIAALGLFGLSAFAAERRTKEIGIRKAMGATKRNVMSLLLWQFTKPVLWANAIAWPAAYLIMHRWLDGFAYHIDLQPWMFLAASGLALIIAVLTVIVHALLVARARPVTALRYE